MWVWALGVVLAGCDATCTIVGCDCQVDEDCAGLGPGGRCVGGACGRWPDAGSARDAGRSDAGPTDAGGGADAGRRADAGRSDSGADAGPTGGRVGPAIRTTDAVGMVVEPELGCLGTRTAPVGGGIASYDVRVTALGHADAIPGATIQIWTGNNPNTTGGCPARCVAATSGAAGTVPVMTQAGSWVAYRALAQDVTVGGVGESIVTTTLTNLEAGQPLMLLTQTTVSILEASVGVPSSRQTVTLLGRATDCLGRPIENAYVRVFDGATEITGTDQAQELYFEGGLPRPGQPSTSAGGEWAVAGLPPLDSTRYRVETWGSRSDDAPAVRLGCELMFGLDDSVSASEIGPLRGDGPMACGGSTP